MSRAQTIQIFLPSGNPQGLRQAEITTRTVQVFDIPRSTLPEFLDASQSHQVALYFLLGSSLTGDQVDCYIGESDDVGQRLRSHDRKKEFWDRALVAVSLTNTWTKAHVRYLEAKAVKTAREAGRYRIINANEGFASAYTPAPLQADCDEFFDTVSVLIATLGHSVLRPVQTKQATRPEQVLYVRSRQRTTAGTYSTDGLTVFAGTVCDKPAAGRKRYEQVEARREALLADGVLARQDDHLVFARDWVFSSPSGAASIILGRPSNGWDVWRDPQGRTLDAIERSAADQGRSDESPT
ncbi:MAG: GIY-YIG nuclease family protein [Actinomycetia bacterium]|nr:GIY-YIG nuclease family protein [Actinomycetes bacterium]